MFSQLVLAFALTTAAATPTEASVPVNMQGVWGKHGRCDVLADRLTITRNRAGWGKGPFARVSYDTQSEAIAWDEEYVVDNFVIGRTPDVLVHNTQGFHMPGEEGYARCTHKGMRMPWPPAGETRPAPPDPRDKHIERIFASMTDRYEAAVREASGKTHRCRVMKDDLRCACFQGPRGSFTIFDNTDGIFDVNVISAGKARVIVHGAHDSELGVFVRSQKDPACWVGHSDWSPICVW